MKSISCLLIWFPGNWIAACCGETAGAATGMVMTVGTPWVVEDGQPEAVQRALQNVEKDWYKVFGRRPVVVKEIAASWKGPVIYLGLTGSWRDKLAKEQRARTQR